MDSAVRIAELGLATALDELAPGVSERTLTGVLMEAMAAGGVSTPATQDAAWVTSRDQPWHRGAAEARPGDLVAFAAGALANGYVAEVGRTWPVGDDVSAGARSLLGSDALYDNMLGACRPARPLAICLPPTARPVSPCRRCRCARSGAWLRSTGGVRNTRSRGRRRSARGRDGTGPHRLRVATGRRGGVPPGHGPDYRRWRRRADRQPVVGLGGIGRVMVARTASRVPAQQRAWSERRHRVSPTGRGHLNGQKPGGSPSARAAPTRRSSCLPSLYCFSLLWPPVRSAV